MSDNMPSRGPRVTQAEIELAVNSLRVETHHFPNTNVTVAAAFMPDGFCVAIAKSGSISNSNFDAQIGIDIATRDVLAAAKNKLWELEGYLLRDRIARASMGNYQD
jgi:hypothetical protein